MPTVPINLTTLPAHSIFSSGSGKEKQDDWELVDAPNDDLVGTKSSRMILRDKDLIVAFGSQVRICTLAGEGWKIDGDVVGSYKTLKSECLNFQAESLVLNPTERLLAVVGKKQVAVLVLPTLRLGDDSTGELDCRAFAIDEFDYSAASSAIITKVLWHPLGEGGESLWILTSDGRLQEYDIRSPDDPTQTFTFLPQASTSSSSKFTAIDPLSRYATSFTFTPYSPSTFDFSPLTVTVLIANGDVYTMNPILPLRAELPLRYLQGLKSYVRQRRRMAEDHKDGEETDRADSWDIWVGHLIKQYKEGSKIDDSPNKAPKRSTSIPHVADKQDTVKVHPPHLTSTGGPAAGAHKALMRQGPIIFSPAPQEADDGDEENYASDITVMRVSTSDADEEEDGSSEEVRVMSIVWSSSRVDIGLCTEVSEPEWVEKDTPIQTSPTIPILESVYLNNALGEEPSFAPIFTTDAVYGDTIHIRHSRGLSSINTRPLLDAVLAGDSDTGSIVSSHVVTDGSQQQAIIGSAGFCNISLGYGVLALTASQQLATPELDFRVSGHTTLAPTSQNPDSASQSSTDDRSYLAKQPDLSTLIQGTITYTKYTPPNIRANKDIRGPIENITAAHLKLLGEVTTEIRKRTEAIRAASQKVENRLDLQVREYQRQIKLLKSTRGEMKGLSGDDGSERVSAIAKKQRELGDRLDRVLSSAMASHKGPDVSESERKWFEELEKLHTQMGGLSTRFSQVSQEVDKAKSEPKSTPKPVEQPTKDSGKDFKPIQTQVDAESEEIRKMLRKMDRLSVRVEAAMIEGEESD